MSKPTPGPWLYRAASSFDHELDDGRVERIETPPHVAVIDHDEEGRRRTRFVATCEGHGCNNEANAHLIAAAPDLLEACKHMLDFCPAGLLPDLKAAIAKAEVA